MFPLPKLRLSDVAAEKGVAVQVDAVAEVLASHANTCSLPALEVSVINKSPFLHGYPLQYACTSTDKWLSATDIPTNSRTCLLSTKSYEIQTLKYALRKFHFGK